MTTNIWLAVSPVITIVVLVLVFEWIARRAVDSAVQAVHLERLSILTDLKQQLQQSEDVLSQLDKSVQQNDDSQEPSGLDALKRDTGRLKSVLGDLSRGLEALPDSTSKG